MLWIARLHVSSLKTNVPVVGTQTAGVARNEDARIKLSESADIHVGLAWVPTEAV